MKTLLRIIGSLVVVLCLAAFVLFKLNEKGFISGALSDWVSSITAHVIGIKNETKDFLEEEGITLPTARPTDTAAPQPTDTPVPEITAAPESGEPPVLTSGIPALTASPAPAGN